ncbi:MAG TPA: ATP-dependent helicase, partial [Candidatus Cloacimonas sp.]|nr:ATP-dependent helicase [Candidatus Cloacimonas sp.]
IFISNPQVYEETQRLIERSEAHKDGVYSARLNELPYYQKLMRQNPAIRLMQDEWLNQLAIDLQRRHLGQPAVLPPNLQNILRGYQKAGVAWLQMLQHYGLNGILADEMGLGKTIQALSVLQGTPDGRISLLICPKTLLYNWVAEIEKFHTNIPHLVVEGDKLTREELLSQPNVKLLLISYSLVLNDLELLKDFDFYYIVLDEAQNIKNPSAQRTAAIKKLKSENRLALSGTPMENRLTELWSLFDFLMPGYLRSLKSFKDTYEKAEDQELAQQRLQRMVAPFILRRIKKEVLLELPDKQEQISWCKLGTVQEKAYLQVLENVKKQLFPAESSGAISYMHILSALTKLRQICNHPHLINPDIKPEPAASSKLEQLLHLLEESLAGEHKVLVFSQFVQMLTIIRRAIEDCGWEYCYLDGRTKNRMQVVNEFEHNPDKRIFLISLKAGGTGLNLTVADTVILFDPWWNPMVENQAIDRAHRIGQTNKVQVVRLISKGTVEEKIIALQQSKLAMFENIVSGDRQVLSSLSTEDIKALFEY